MRQSSCAGGIGRAMSVQQWQMLPAHNVCLLLLPCPQHRVNASAASPHVFDRHRRRRCDVRVQPEDGARVRAQHTQQAAQEVPWDFFDSF